MQFAPNGMHFLFNNTVIIIIVIIIIFIEGALLAKAVFNCGPYALM